MNEPRDHNIVHKVLDFTFFGKHDNPVDAILHDMWTGLAGLGLVMIGGRLLSSTGWRALLRAILEFAGVWLLGLILRYTFRGSFGPYD
jgi:hypothetical protein